MPRNRCWLTLPGHTHNCRTKSKFLSLWSAERLIKHRKKLTKTKLPFYRHVSERNTFHDCGLKQFFFHGGDGRDLHKRAQYSLLPLAFSKSGQIRTPEEQLVGNPCPEGCASRAHRCWQLTLSTLRTLLSLSLWDPVSSCISLALPLKAAQTAPSLPGEVIQPSHTAQLRLCKPSRQQVIFVLYKSIFGISVAFPATK